MSELDDKAAATKRARATERKRRERRGDRVLQVEAHMLSLAQMLLAEGLLKEGDFEDVAAIEAATAEHLRNHQRVGRLLPDIEGGDHQRTPC